MLNKIKQFSSFAVAIMKICDHSEVIGEMSILETNTWQTAFRITQMQTSTKFLESFIYFTHTFLQKMYFS